nr:universal stress protein [Oculatella sp. LEGE 06141]
MVAIDRSPSSVHVFEQALGLAQSEKANLVILHCLRFADQDSYSDLYGNDLSSFSQTMQDDMKRDIDDAQRWLSTYRDRAIAVGVAADCNLALGHAGRRICRLAQTWNADLIVTGRRGRQVLTEMLLGSTSNFVLHHAACSVLVVQGVEG